MNMRILAAALTASVLTACVTPPPPPPEAVLQFTPAAPCANALSAATAVSLTPEAPTGVFGNSAPFGDPNTPCFADAQGVAAPYAMFALPEGQVASVSAGAIIEARRVLAVRVSTLDANLNSLRTFAADDFQHRGRTYSVLFRPATGEKYVQVTADASAIGRHVSFVTGDPATVPLPPHLNARASDFRAQLSAPFSFEGTAFARVYFNPPDAPPSAE
jgi:hypothetical protein